MSLVQYHKLKVDKLYCFKIGHDILLHELFTNVDDQTEANRTNTPIVKLFIT